MGKLFLIVVDSHSKWLEVEVMSSITSEATIEKLQVLFARYSIPQLGSDNGSQFTSQEFTKFMKGNVIKHTLVAPYHPRSNGQAERFVQTFKQFFKAEGSDSIKQSLARFLFSYRTTPNSTTGQTPAELFLNRRVRTRLDLIHPDLGRKVFNKQSDQKTRHDKSSSEREFALGEQVLVQNFRGEPKWLDGTVTEQTDPLSYKVLVSLFSYFSQPLHTFENMPGERIIFFSVCSRSYMFCSDISTLNSIAMYFFRSACRFSMSYPSCYQFICLHILIHCYSSNTITKWANSDTIRAQCHCSLCRPGVKYGVPLTTIES